MESTINGQQTTSNYNRLNICAPRKTLTMKKFLILTLLLSASYASLAQRPEFGFDIGFNLSQGKYKPDQGLDQRIIGGFDGGIFVKFDCGKKFEFQPELNYVVTGVELNDRVTETESSIKLQYLSIAAIGKWKVTDRFRILAGPAHSILLSAWVDPSGGGLSTEAKGAFKFTDLIVTGGVEYLLGKKVSLAARYNHGMEQIVEDGLGFTMKNRYLSLKIACLL